MDKLRHPNAWRLAILAALIAFTIAALVFLIAGKQDNTDQAQTDARQARSSARSVQSSASRVETQGKAAASQAAEIKDAAEVFISKACPYAQVAQVRLACTQLGYAVQVQSSIVSVGGTATPPLVTIVQPPQDPETVEVTTTALGATATRTAILQPTPVPPQTKLITQTGEARTVTEQQRTITEQQRTVAIFTVTAPGGPPVTVTQAQATTTQPAPPAATVTG